MAEPAPPSIESEVLGNIVAQPISAGPVAHTVADLGLPEPYLRRIADRIIRSSFEERHRAVVAATPGTSPPLHSADSPQPPRPREREIRPVLRGFRATEDGWPIDPPGDVAPAGLREAASIVATRLFVDGLAATACAAIEAIGTDAAKGRETLDLLRRAGLPVDLLAWFDPGGRGDADAEIAVSGIAGLLRTGATACGLRDRLRALPMRARQTVAGFRVQAESGDRELDLIRLQLTRGDYWLGRGDGGNLDMVRQLVERLPDCRVVVAMENEIVGAFRAESAKWKLGRPERLTIVEAPEPIAQWAQDNAKPGDSPAEGGAVLLTPRFPTRGEGVITFTPGESAVMRPLAAVLEGQVRIAQSPLLFQGGNLMAVHDPIAGELVLLAGEAEIHRNVSLGLTPEQAAEALRLEFGADRLVVLPAASFHIDYEVSVRSTPAGVVAFVNDQLAAARIILGCGLRALRNKRLIHPRDIDRAIKDLDSGDVTGATRVAVAFCQRAAVRLGQFSEESAAALAYGPGDSGVGNLHRFLLAMDVIGAGIGAEEFPIPDDHTHAHFRALARNQADRELLHETLAGLGWKVVPIPAISAEGRGISPINGVHDRTRYLLPAYGGLYEAVDQAAMRIFRREMGPRIAIVPIYCAESQRRNGSVHCSVSAMYERPSEQ